jgi:hypothetical protein
MRRPAGAAGIGDRGFYLVSCSVGAARRGAMTCGTQASVSRREGEDDRPLANGPLGRRLTIMGNRVGFTGPA